MCASGLVAQAQVTKLPDGFTSGEDATKDNWEKNKPNSKWSQSGGFKRILCDNLSVVLNTNQGSKTGNSTDIGDLEGYRK